MAGEVVALIFWLGIIPFCVGLVPMRFIEYTKRRIGTAFFMGYLVWWSFFQLLAVPFVVADAWGFLKIVPIYKGISITVAILGVILTITGKRTSPLKLVEHKKSLEEIFGWVLVTVLLLFQLYMAVSYMSFDGDDAVYVVHSLQTEETNTLYRINPFMGRSTGLDIRHCLAVFPVWISYISRVTGVHSTIISHTVLPVVLIPLTYLIYLEIGRRLLRKDKEKLPLFMFAVMLLQVFGNVSIYTNATFFLMRTWQGKSIFANIVIPVIFLFLLWLFDSKKESSSKKATVWCLLFCTNMVAAMATTMSVFLSAFLIAVSGLVLAIADKDWKVLPKLACCCIPCVGYALVFLWLR